MLTIKNASLAFAKTIIFSNLNLTLPIGKWVALLGRSGVGKSSLLRAIGGLCSQLKGEIETDDRIAYMAQTDLLVPWMNVLKNAMLGAILRGQCSNAVIDETKYLLNRVGLSHALTYYPRQLSGGMRQRVALVRTLMEKRSIVLMDEPFSALDAITRYQLHDLTAELLNNKTVLFVTHDPLEALRLADEIYIMHPYPRSLKRVLSLDMVKPRPLTPFLADKQQVLYDEPNTH